MNKKPKGEKWANTAPLLGGSESGKTHGQMWKGHQKDTAGSEPERLQWERGQAISSLGSSTSVSCNNSIAGRLLPWLLWRTEDQEDRGLTQKLISLPTLRTKPCLQISTSPSGVQSESPIAWTALKDRLPRGFRSTPTSSPQEQLPSLSSPSRDTRSHMGKGPPAHA